VRRHSNSKLLISGLFGFFLSNFHLSVSLHFHTERQNVRFGSRQGVSSSFSKSSKKNHFTTQ